MTVTRGASNGNKRGNNTARRERRAWLLATYRANVAVIDPATGVAVPTARCYRCGELVTNSGTAGTLVLTVDRIVPGVLGGLYRTVRRDRREKVTNIRPACDPCNSETGGALAGKGAR